MPNVLVFLLVIAGALARGDPNLNWRIIGGKDAPAGQYPYQVSLRYDGRHNCGGSIIDSRNVLTAAHCVQGMSASKLSVVVGSNKINSGGLKYDVRKIRSHILYNPLTINNDIAVLNLKTELKFSENVSAVELDPSDVGGGVDVVLTGWGLTSYPSETIPDNLQFVDLKTINTKVCKKMLGLLSPVGDNQVCTLTQEGQGACKGDSGGPLVANGRQVGIVSWGRPCGLGKPDVYTRVSSYIDWIKEHSD